MFKNSYPTYRPDLIEKARKLRRTSTPGEIELWNLLKNKQVLGYKFRRQRPIDNFIIDFYCKELKLAIEIDGASHDYKMEYDNQRQSKLEELGITFLRFYEEDTRENADYVVIEIKKWIESYLKLHPTLPSIPSGGGEAHIYTTRSNSKEQIHVKGKLSNQFRNYNNESSSPGRGNKGEGL